MESRNKKARINESLWSDWISSKPSTTILVFNIIPTFSASDVCNLFQNMGTIKAVEVVPDGTVALVEFNSVVDVVRIVELSRTQPICIGSDEVFVEFCLHKLWHAHEAHCVGSVLRIDITESVYPVTVKTLQTVCQPVASAVRILIGPKTTPINDDPRSSFVCALVEVEGNTQALALRDALDDQAIYTGCCLLHVSFSALPMVPVRINDNTVSWDFSRPYLAKGSSATKVGLLGNRPAPDHMDSNLFHFPPPPIMQGLHGNGNAMNSMLPAPTPVTTEFLTYAPADGTTLFINGLNMDVFNCDRIFNLVSLYGNVARIKFLVKRPGVAMVQMGTPEQGKLLMDFVNGLYIFGRQLHMVVSKDKLIKESRDPLPPLEDGSPSMKNYMNNHNNRFRQGANKSRLVPPTSTLHFFNAPASINEEQLRQICVDNGATAPERIVVFPIKEGQKSSLGLMEWPSVHEAAQALVHINSVVIKDATTNQPYHVKFAFSSKPIIAAEAFKYSSRKRNAENEVSITVTESA
jgi:heterogeneous nuclear ribonucleoprotein L